jgi:hypothetical protein
VGRVEEVKCVCVRVCLGEDLLRPVSRSKTTLASVMEPNSANTCFIPHVYQYVYASQLSKTVPVICEHNGVLLQLFFLGERGLFQCLQ